MAAARRNHPAHPARHPSVRAHFYTLEAAAAGLGGGLSPWIYVAADMAAGRLAAPLGFVATPSRFWFLAPPGSTGGPVAALRDWLIEEAAKAPPPPALTLCR